MSLQSLEREFDLPLSVIEELGEARRIDDLHANGFGSYKINQPSPINKIDTYTKHGLSFERGEEISWAYIWETM